MFYSWSNANKITTKSLQIQYTGSYTKTYAGNRVYEFHRIASKEYQYVGMTEAAAKACQDAKLAQYTRKFVQWFNQNGNYGKYREFKCVANVTMNNDEDGLWTVNISVNEDQMQYYAAFDVDAIPYGLFDTGLNYDEDPLEGGFLRISSVWLENQRLYIAYQQNISGFDRAQLVIQNSTDGGATWSNISPTSSTDGQVYFNSGAWSQGLVRLRFGDTIFSNVEATPSQSYSNTLELYQPYWQVVGGSYGAWRIQFAQSFPDFDAAEMRIETRSSPQDGWTDITESCDAFGDRITTPYTEQETLFYARAKYSGQYSNTVNTLFYFLVVDSNLSVTVTSNQVDTVVLSFVNGLGEDLDSSKISIGYRDSITSRTYSGNQIQFAEDENHNCTVTFNVGDQIVGTSMDVYATLKYDDNIVTTVSKKVYRT